MDSSHDPGPTYATPSAAKPFQFSLWHLFVLPVWLALLFASISWLGAVGAVLFILASCFLLGVFVRGLRWLAVVTVVVSCAGLLLPARETAREAARRCQCVNNLKQIGLALHNYQDVWKCFPPQCVADAEGRPLYSWRVLILPYLEQQPLYSQFHLDEPWDSPNNLPLSQTRIDVLLCPSQVHGGPGQGSFETDYLAVVGTGTMWPEGRSTSFGDLKDDTSNTLAVVEVRDSGVHWAEPRDLSVDQMAPGVNPAAGQGISSAHPEGANVLFADAHVQFLSSATTPDEIRGMLSIAGGEKLDPSGL